jgi:hypothetical protein
MSVLLIKPDPSDIHPSLTRPRPEAELGPRTARHRWRRARSGRIKCAAERGSRRYVRDGARRAGRRTRSVLGEGVLSGRGGSGVIATFQNETGKQVKLVQPTQDEMLEQTPGALEAGQPPDFLYGTFTVNSYGRWATRTGSSTSRTRFCRPRPVRSRRARLRHPVRRDLRSARSLRCSTFHGVCTP